MEITKLSGNALKLKGKKANLLVDVIDIKKTEANAYLFLREDVQKAGYNKENLLISGPGDYEISGVKVTATKISENLFYEVTIDGLRMLLTNASKLSAGKEKLGEEHALVLFADAVIDQSTITNFSPSVVVCYGDEAEKLGASLGKGLGKKDAEDASASADAELKPVDKYSMTADKLPAELEVVLLK